ncbi:hypothetical protein OROHE_000294 [Orobanche hederae]
MQSPKRRRSLVDESPEDDHDKQLIISPSAPFAAKPNSFKVEEIQDEEMDAEVVPLLTNLPFTPEEEEADIMIQIPEASYSFNLFVNNPHNLTRAQLNFIKGEIENVDYIHMHQDWQGYRMLPYSHLRHIVKAISWDGLITLEDFLLEFCHTPQVSRLMDKNWFSIHFSENMDKFILGAMFRLHTSLLAKEEKEKGENESVFEVGTSSSVPIVEKEGVVEGEKEKENEEVVEKEDEKDEEVEKEVDENHLLNLLNQR